MNGCVRIYEYPQLAQKRSAALLTAPQIKKYVEMAHFMLIQT